MAEITDTERLDALIDLILDSGLELSSDFEQILFFVKRAKTVKAKYRKALDQWIKEERA